MAHGTGSLSSLSVVCSALLTIACEDSTINSAGSLARPAVSASAAAATSSATQKPLLRDGDLVFQESMSRQSEMVRALTGSEWTHMGVVFLNDDQPLVLEAVSPVRYTKLDQWIARGRRGRYVVKRLREAERHLDRDVVRKMRSLGDGWLGLPYDLKFEWGDEALYCSELAYKLFERASGVRVGRIQRASDMNLNDEKVRTARARRFSPGQFDPDEPVVTPASMFEDGQLETVIDSGGP